MILHSISHIMYSIPCFFSNLKTRYGSSQILISFFLWTIDIDIYLKYISEIQFWIFRFEYGTDIKCSHSDTNYSYSVYGRILENIYRVFIPRQDTWGRWGFGPLGVPNCKLGQLRITENHVCKRLQFSMAHMENNKIVKESYSCTCTFPMSPTTKTFVIRCYLLEQTCRLAER
jgi:hypothetical protein